MAHQDIEHVTLPLAPAVKPLEYLSDPLTPAAAQDYEHRLEAFTRELDDATGALGIVWNDRNDARWGGRNKSCTRDMRQADDPIVLAAEAKIAPARERWYRAHEALRTFIAAPLELHCGVRDWRKGQYARCALAAAHDGRHDFESEIHVEGTPE